MTGEDRKRLKLQLREYIRKTYIPEDSFFRPTACICYDPSPTVDFDACFSRDEASPFNSPDADISFDAGCSDDAAPCAAPLPKSEAKKTCAAPRMEEAREMRSFSAKAHSPGRKGSLLSLLGKNMAYELDESFGESVRRLIGEKRLSKGEFYARANVNSAWLSNVVKNNVTPKKEQALACCIGLRLNSEETQSLLEKAGYTLSNSNLRDVIVKFFIENRCYDIDMLNEELYDHDLVPLGQSMK